MEIKSYINPANENERGVLISPGYGAGWSTWNDSRLAYDSRVVEFWLDHKDAEGEEVKEFCESIGYPNVYCGGYGQLELIFVKAGSSFLIEEYDGSESLEMIEDLPIITLE